MVAPTQVKSFVTDLVEVGQAFVDTVNPLKTYIDSLLGGGAGLNNEFYDTSTLAQQDFDVSPVDPTYAIVFVGGVFQPPSTYTIAGSNIHFLVGLPAGLRVEVIERKLARITSVHSGGVLGQVLTKTGALEDQFDWVNPVTGGGGSNSPGTTLALAHYHNCTTSPVESLDLFSNVTFIKSSTGLFFVTLLGITFPDTNSYTIHTLCDGPTASTLNAVVTVRSTTSFVIEVRNSSGVLTDPSGLNIIVSGSPLLAPTNIVAAPVGIVSWYAASTPPVGYLECNGQSISRTAYAALFQIIGITYGSVDAFTFKVPDLRGRFIRGWNHGAGDDDTHDEDPSRVFGSFQADSFKAHTHTASVATLGAVSIPNGSYWPTPYTTAVTTSSTGGDETRSRNVALLPCIKAIPDLNSYAATQLCETFTTTLNQVLITTTQVDTRYCYVFVDGAYQPPSQYTTPQTNQIQFNTAPGNDCIVDVVKIYTASPPVATKAAMLSATSDGEFVTPHNFKDSPFAQKAWAKFSGVSVLTYVQEGIFSITYPATGRYTLTWATPFANLHYVITAMSFGGPATFYVESQTAAAATLVAVNSSGVNINPMTIYVTASGIQ